MVKIIELKCWIRPYRAIEKGQKTAEFRFNDRDYMKGDLLLLRQWDNDLKIYGGEHTLAEITHVQEGFGIPAG